MPSSRVSSGGLLHDAQLPTLANPTPNSKQAGFYMTHSSNRERAAAQKAHADFLAAYGLTELDVPMVVLDLTDAPDATDAYALTLTLTLTLTYA